MLASELEKDTQGREDDGDDDIDTVSVGKMNNGIIFGLREHLFEIILVPEITKMECEILRKFGPGETPDAINSLLDGVVEVVDDGDPEPLFQELQHCVGADEPGTAGHQDIAILIGYRHRSHQGRS